MDAATIDELLARYTTAEQRIAANLVEFDDHPTYTLLSAGGVHGVTKDRLGPVMGGVPRLWSLLRGLNATMAAARDIRADGRLSGRDRDQLRILLTGPSVLVGTESTPLAERDLLASSSEDQRVTIEQVLTLMRDGYEPIRDGVAEVDEVWRSVLPRVDAAMSTLASLRADLDELGMGDASVEQAEQLATSVQSTAFDDPLGLPAEAGDDLDAAVAKATASVAKVRAARDGLDGDLASIESMLADLRLLRARAAAAWSETSAKILDPQGLRRVPGLSVIDGPGGLAEQADALEAKSHGEWQTRRADLDRLLGTARRLREQLRRAEADNRAPLDQRNELRGLLAAYRAKATALRLADRPDLADLADDAHNELFTTPADLLRARDLVAGYGSALGAT